MRQKAGLNRSILRQSWGLFLRLLEYKLKFSGGELIFVNPNHTNQRCPRCGLASKSNRKSQSLFVCENCGYRDNTDHVAAVNVPPGRRDMKPVEIAESAVCEAGTSGKPRGSTAPVTRDRESSRFRERRMSAFLPMSLVAAAFNLLPSPTDDQFCV
ncbi:zinc ribbon domain-containing protein [Palaeococcus sp. (in: euryarchaeotes)]